MNVNTVGGRVQSREWVFTNTRTVGEGQWVMTPWLQEETKETSKSWEAKIGITQRWILKGGLLIVGLLKVGLVKVG